MSATGIVKSVPLERKEQVLVCSLQEFMYAGLYTTAHTTHKCAMLNENMCHVKYNKIPLIILALFKVH